MTPQLAMARQFSALELSVIPIPRPRPGVPVGKPGDGKVPAIVWGKYQKRRATDEELLAWFDGEPMNLAVVTGAISGVVVIDADDPAALRWCTRHLKYTPWQTRTARGFHLWYRYPEIVQRAEHSRPSVHVGNRARLETGDGRLAIDVRGDGGYVIAPGSVHASGKEYRQAGDWNVPRERVPVFWAGWLRRPPRPLSPTPQPLRPTGDLVERARRYLAAIPPPVIGQGSDVAVFKAACRLVRGFGLPVGETATLLWEWAGQRPGWTYEWVTEKASHAEPYGTEPVGGLR